MSILHPLLILSLIVAAFAQDACTLTPDPGPCEEALSRWFYNATSKSCESFIFGGCDGVVPFETQQECVSATCDPCSKKPKPGTCEGSTSVGWFYHNRKAKCQSFTTGDCENSVVPFATEEDCELEECVQQVRPRSRRKTLLERCDVTPNPGPCRENLTRWYWDDDTQNCESFQYGGCFGRAPYSTKSQCVRAGCDNRDVCEMVPEKGPCSGDFPRWYYNATTDSCEKFEYGGCMGAVPFDTRTDCEASSCVRDRCALKPERGPCDGNITKYYFNQETGTCDTFSYSGCFGVVPYESLGACEDAECTSSRCELAPVRGSCDENITKWYFDSDSGDCASFEWSGCGGVVPFDTKEECMESGCKGSVNRCDLVPDPGPCRALSIRWFWNQEFQRCEQFAYGGCNGTVPFDTEELCEQALCAGFEIGNNEEVKGRI